MNARTSRPPRGSRGTIGGDFADWLIGTGIFALLLAAFGLFGLPWLASRPAAVSPLEVHAPPDRPQAEHLPLTRLAPLEVPMPGADPPARAPLPGTVPPTPGSGAFQPHPAGAIAAGHPPAGDTAPQTLRPEVAALVSPPVADAPLEAHRADGFVAAQTPIRLPGLPSTERVSVAELTARHGGRRDAQVTVRREVSALAPRRLVDLLQRASIESLGAGETPPRPLEDLAEDLRSLLARAETAAPSSAPPADDTAAGTPRIGAPAASPPANAPPADEAASNDALAFDPARMSHLRRVLTASGIDPLARFTVVIAEGRREELSLLEILATGVFIAPAATLQVQEQGQQFERIPLAALEAMGDTTEVEVVTGLGEERIVTVAELMGVETTDPDTLYYVRTVQPQDTQGVWGIVQFGVTDTFARGIRLGTAGSERQVVLEIPADADELEGRQSSFLGRLIARKVAASLVYNLTDGRMGRNPHLIHPGQELVIVGFAPAELNAIHDYFQPSVMAGADAP